MRFHGSGVAAIVGPNGCGKSNLSDAISWVLGEQSAKSLRGARMEDVIFAGTRDRKPVGMAQVTMTLVDPGFVAEKPHTNGVNGHANGHTNGHTNGHANGLNGHAVPDLAGMTNAIVDPVKLEIQEIGRDKLSKRQEVTITRRLFRSGESEYLVDGKQARLRDIQDLFMGSGLGPESYAIIEQGRIGQILSSRPHDRRAVIEEAAGVTRFKTKRRLAEAKLEGAKQNLTRVFDILEEVGRQVNSLKRQAAKTKRYEELKGEMISHLRTALFGRYQVLEHVAAGTAAELTGAAAEVLNLVSDIAEREKAYSALLEESYAVEADLTGRRRELSELQIEAERTRGRLASQAQQIAAIEQRLTRGETETQDVEHRVKQMEADCEIHRQKLAELETQAVSARERLTAKNEERDTLQAKLRSREQAIESSRQIVLRLLGEASTLRNQLAQVDEYLASMERDKARIEKDEQGAASELERINGIRKELSEKAAQRQMDLESTADQKRRVEEELSVRRNSAVETRRQLEQLRGDASRLKARRDSLADIISHRSYTTESVKRLFTAVAKGSAEGVKPVGVLADFVEVDSQYEKAAEEFLHEELEYVVVSDWLEAEAGIDLMRKDLDGRATFLVHPKPEAAYSSRPAQEPAIGPETGIAARLSDVLKMTNGLTKAPAELLPRLARCYLATDRASAQRLALQYPDIYFLLADGVCYHGHAVSGGRKTGSGPLALKRELRELTTQANAKQKQLDASVSRLEELEREIAALSEELDVLRQRQQGQEKEALVIDQEMRKLGEELGRANQRVSVARLELERLHREAGRSRDQRERNVILLTEKDTARQANEAALEMAREEMSGLQHSVAMAVEEHSVLRVEVASAEERRRAEGAAQARLENQIRELTNRRAHLLNEIERLGTDRARLLSDNMELDARVAQLTEQVSVAQNGVAKVADHEQTLRARLAESDEQLKARRSRTQESQEKKTQIELRLVKLQAELKFLDETSHKELQCALTEIVMPEGFAIDDETLAASETKYQEVRARIDALGPVNPQALEEFQEASQRYDFLNAQRQDLLDSIRDTEKAIQEIDVESRKRFGEAFEVINANFREMFKALFGGGIGEMRLTDEQNLSESGIDIVASPPGKRLQNVLLLSGGEKSLTAMALLMAIFKYQPSPFCILDEVDAALDEANTLRLTRLLREMASETQFIVITHAKRTMEMAETMYGVTMQEPGVSKLVSVKFKEQASAMPPPAARAMAAAAN